MPKYVDIEKFDIAAVYDDECASWSSDKLKKYLEITYRLLNKLPTEEMKRAKWLKIPLQKYPDEYVFRCSNCNHKSIFDSDYCTSCGAKMEGSDAEVH